MSAEKKYLLIFLKSKKVVLSDRLAKHGNTQNSLTYKLCFESWVESKVAVLFHTFTVAFLLFRALTLQGSFSNPAEHSYST